MERGYIHLYIGNGKGKTTAAFGLAVRALMAGRAVYIGQFVKDMAYNETKLAEHLDRLTIRSSAGAASSTGPMAPSLC